jgi:hypothetical protein
MLRAVLECIVWKGLTTKRKFLLAASYVVLFFVSTGVGVAANVELRAHGIIGQQAPRSAPQGAWPRPRNISGPPPGTPALFEAGRFAALRFQCRGG